MTPNPPSKAHGFATCKFPNLKKILGTPCRILATPMIQDYGYGVTAYALYIVNAINYLCTCFM